MIDNKKIGAAMTVKLSGTLPEYPPLMRQREGRPTGAFV